MLKLIKSVTRSIIRAIVEDPEVRKLVQRHPRFFGFLKKRTDSDARFGLNLTLGVIIAGFFLVLFLGIVQDLIGNEALVLADLRIVNLLQIFRTPSFNRKMLFITYLGKGQLIIVGVVAVGAVLASRRRWYHVIALLTSVAVGEFLVLLLKNLIQRPRPPLVNVLAPEQTYSFPSGHSFVAIAFYGLLAYFVFTSVTSRLVKALTIIAALSIILAIGFSRIYLGAHFPSDVLGGYAAGLAWLTAIITALEIRMRDNPYRNLQPYVSKNAAVIIGLLAFTVWGGSVLYYYETHPLKAPSMTVEAPMIISPRDIPGKLFLRYPRVSEDITGKPMEPINIIIIGNKQMLDKAFRDAGWQATDKISFGSLYKLAAATITRKSYPKAPGTPSFWNARPNDFAYEKPTRKDKVSEREHIHFWNTSFQLGNGERVWFSTAHFDRNIVLKNSVIPTHEIDPAIDKEREKVKSELVATGDTSRVGEFQIVEPTLGKNQAGSGFFTDGRAYFIFLKP